MALNLANIAFGVPHDAAWVQSYGAIGAATFAAIGLFLNWQAINTQIRLSRAQKQIDVVMECNRRYVAASAQVRRVIQSRVAPISKDSGRSRSGIELSEAFRAFWLVYYEEWQFFRIGMIPKSFFIYWCNGLVRNFSAASMEGFGSQSLWQSWKEFGESSWGYTGGFVDHVRHLKEISELPEWDRLARVTIAITEIKRRAKSIHAELGI